jgi:hypothetical protein
MDCREWFIPHIVAWFRLQTEGTNRAARELQVFHKKHWFIPVASEVASEVDSQLVRPDWTE